MHCIKHGPVPAGKTTARRGGNKKHGCRNRQYRRLPQRNPQRRIWNYRNHNDGILRNSVQFIAKDAHEWFVFCFKKTDKQYTEMDVDLRINNNLGSGYNKFVESYRNSDLHKEVKKLCIK